MYTFQSLSEKTREDVRKIAYREFNLVGYSDAPKGECIDAILNAQDQREENERAAEDAPETGNDEPIDELVGGFRVTSDADGEVETNIYVSCGAASGNFAVIGKTVGTVKDLLSEALNIDPAAEAVVIGTEVGEDYVLKAEDRLEFIKRAGRKG